jgi:Leucine Rich repeat
MLLGSSLIDNTTMQELDISHNSIDDVGAFTVLVRESRDIALS